MNKAQPNRYSTTVVAIVCHLVVVELEYWGQLGLPTKVQPNHYSVLAVATFGLVVVWLECWEQSAPLGQGKQRKGAKTCSNHV